LTIELRHIVPKCTFELAIGLRVLWRGMDKPNPRFRQKASNNLPRSTPL
jgi:hypothetical protein